MWKDSIMVNFKKTGNYYSGIAIASFYSQDVNKTLKAILFFRYTNI